MCDIHYDPLLLFCVKKDRCKRGMYVSLFTDVHSDQIRFWETIFVYYLIISLT